MSAPYIANEERPALATLTIVVVTVALMGTLYWARSLLIPLALAAFLTFILSPAVMALRRRRLGRGPAVALVVSATICVVMAVAGVISWQLASLVQDLPNHQARIRDKLVVVRDWAGGLGDGRLANLVREAGEALKVTPDVVEPIPVVIADSYGRWVTAVEGILGPAAEVLGYAAFTFVLTVFLLLNKEDMRNRFLWLIGHSQLTAATKAVDDAGLRISRFLRTQLIINAAFGAVLAIFLLVLGVPYAILWGLVAAVARYIPYIGAWIGLLPPLLAALAMADGFVIPLLLLLGYSVVEVVTANVIEPRWFGQSLGLSEVATVVSAAFWAFLWGPIGLVLSGPLTACVLVLGKYVPELRSLDVILGDEDALPPTTAFLQRLTARDRDEAWEIATEFAKIHGPDRVLDEFLLPVVSRYQALLDRHELTEAHADWIDITIREIAEDVATPTPAEPDEVVDASIPVRILIVAAGGRGDAFAAQQLAARLDATRWEVQCMAENVLASGLSAAVTTGQPSIIIIGAVASSGIARARYLCKRVQSVRRNARIIVARWGSPGLPVDEGAALEQAGADKITADITTTLQHLSSWRSVFVAQAQPREPEESPDRVIGTKAASLNA